MAEKFSVDRWYQAITAHDFAQLRLLLAPDARYEDVPTGTVSEGIAAVEAFFQGVWSAFPDMAMVPGQAVEHGDGVAVEWIATGTHLGDFPGLPATGQPFRSRGVSMIRLQGHQVQSVADYWDLASSGLMPQPAGS
jgi:steroid delta-isomerase-like uncharacterized protein